MVNDSKIKSLGKSFRKKYRTLSKQKVEKLPDSICKLIFHSNTTFTFLLTQVPCLNIPQICSIESLSYYHGFLEKSKCECFLENDGDFLLRNNPHDPLKLILSLKDSSSILHQNISLVEVKNKHNDVIEKFYQLEESKKKFDKIAELVNHFKNKSLFSSKQVFLGHPVKSSSITPMSVLAKPSTDKKYWKGSQPLLDQPMLSSSRYGSMPSVHKNMRSDNKEHLESFLSNSFKAGASVVTSSALSTVDREVKSKEILSNDGFEISNNKMEKQDNEDVVTNNESFEANGKFDATQQNPLNDELDNVKLKRDINNNNHKPRDDLVKKATTQNPPPKPHRVPTLKVNSKLGNKPVVEVRKIQEDGDEVEDIESFFTRSHTSKVLDPKQQEAMSLEASKAIINRILASSPAQIARCITEIDMEILGLRDKGKETILTGDGFENIILPLGKVCNEDSVEKHFSLRFLIIATFLNDQPQEDRVKLLCHWLEVAQQLKTCVKNLFSFFTVMDAVCSPQVLKLKGTWLSLKKDHSDIFNNFENVLLVSYKGLLDGSSLDEPYELGTILPHLHPLTFMLAYQESHMSMYMVMSHLTAMRQVFLNCKLYNKAAEEFLRAKDCDQSSDKELLLDVLNPITQATYLWGVNWRSVGGKERRDKMEAELNEKKSRIKSEIW